MVAPCAPCSSQPHFAASTISVRANPQRPRHSTPAPTPRRPSGHPTANTSSSPSPSHPLDSGIEVFRVERPLNSNASPCSPLGAEPAQGILLIPNTRTLAVGLTNPGVAFLPLDAVLNGNADAARHPPGRPPRLGLSRRHARRRLRSSSPTKPSTAAASASSPFVATPRASLRPEPVAQIATPHATPAIALSPDGSRLYAVSTRSSQNTPRPPSRPRHPGSSARKAVSQVANTAPEPNGGLFVFDAADAAVPPIDYSPQHERDATLNLVNAGCHRPANLAITSDGRTLYVVRARRRHRPRLRRRRARARPRPRLPPLHRHERRSSRRPRPLRSRPQAARRQLQPLPHHPGNATVIDLTDPDKPTFAANDQHRRLPTQHHRLPRRPHPAPDPLPRRPANAPHHEMKLL